MVMSGRINLVMTCLLLVATLPSVKPTILSRNRRQLIYPPNGSKTQLILGFGIPIDAPGQSVIMGLVCKYNYRVATNASEILEPYVLYQRRSAPTSTRWGVYSAIESATERLGYDGHACVLRAICEAAATPLETQSGLAGQLLHVLLAPSTTNEDKDTLPEREYWAAERLGSQDGSCKPYKSSCSLSLLDLITKLT